MLGGGSSGGGAVGSVAIGSGALPKYGGRRGGVDRSRRPLFISLLITIKICSSLAVYMLADLLRVEEENSIKLRNVGEGGGGGILGGWSKSVQVVAFIQLMSGVVFIFIQKPISSDNRLRLTPTQWMKICRHSIIIGILMIMWIRALVLSGPFRTVLASSHYDYTLAGIASGLFIVKSGSRLRGGVLFVAGLLALLLYDEGSLSFGQSWDKIKANGKDEVMTVDEEPYISANSKGILILVLFLFGKLLSEAALKTLVADIGLPTKSIHSMTVLTSGILLTILSLIDTVLGGAIISMWSNLMNMIFVVLFGYVMNYYVDAICVKRMDTSQVARIGSSASLISSFVYSLLWISLEDVPQGPTLIAFVLICLGVWSLTSSERASGGGTLVGFSNDGLPLYNFSSHFSSSGGSDQSRGFQYVWKTSLRLIFSFYKQIQEDRTSRRIFYFFILTMSFTSVEFLYGVLTNSLGLISDGFHMLFDALAIFIGLCAAVVSRWKPTPNFPFGYGRTEVISGFLNALFLLVAASAIYMEAWIRLVSPPNVDAHQTLTVSIIGLVVNLIGIFVFRNAHVATLVELHGRSHQNTNIRGVFLHVLADTMGSIGVIFSSLMIKHFGLLIADPICSLVIASLIVTTAWPLLRDTGRILLLVAPPGLEKNLQQVMLQILAADGVKSYKMLRFWTHTSQQLLTGSIHIQATKEANEQSIIRHVNNLFISMGFTQFTTQVEKDEFLNRRNLVLEDDDPTCLTSRNVSGMMEIVGIGPEDIKIDTPLSSSEAIT